MNSWPCQLITCSNQLSPGSCSFRLRRARLWLDMLGNVSREEVVLFDHKVVVAALQPWERHIENVDKLIIWFCICNCDNYNMTVLYYIIIFIKGSEKFLDLLPFSFRVQEYIIIPFRHAPKKWYSTAFICFTSQKMLKMKKSCVATWEWEEPSGWSSCGALVAASSGPSPTKWSF